MYLYNFLSVKAKKGFQRFMRGNDVDITWVLAAFRHAFAHGHITPNSPSNNSDPLSMIESLNILILYHLDILNDHFSAVVEEGVEFYEST